MIAFYFTILLVIVLNLPSMNIGIAGSEAGIQSNLHAVSSTTCLCPGDTLSFECIIVGRGTTVWQGSAFMNCASNYIALLHSQFMKGTSGTCNRGALVGKSLSVDNGVYTSQVNVTISRELDGSRIKCVHDNGTQLLTVGTFKIKLKDPAPPPDRVTLLLDHPGLLTFSWNEVISGCEIVHYRIAAYNCGRCPTTTAHTEVYCTSIPTNSSIICMFAVQTIICNSIAGNMSEPLHVRLRVPDAPRGLKAVPRYSYKSGHFSGITVEFNNEMSIFKITDDTDGSVLFYTVTYTDHISGSVCGSAIVPVSLCNSESRTCKHVFDFLSSCPASNTYNISVFATSLLGNGYPSSIVATISDSTNFSVSFDSSFMRITCKFANQDLRSEKTCSILYGSGNECSMWNSTNIISSSVINTHTDSLIIDLTPLPKKEPINCFIVTATSGMLVAEIEGVIDTMSDSAISDPFHHLTLIISLGVTITLIVTIAMTSFVIIIVARSKVRKKKFDCASINHVATESPVIYEDLDNVREMHKYSGVDLENNVAYTATHTKPH